MPRRIEWGFCGAEGCRLRLPILSTLHTGTARQAAWQGTGIPGSSHSPAHLPVQTAQGGRFEPGETQRVHRKTVLMATDIKIKHPPNFRRAFVFEETQATARASNLPHLCTSQLLLQGQPPSFSSANKGEDALTGSRTDCVGSKGQCSHSKGSDDLDAVFPETFKNRMSNSVMWAPCSWQRECVKAAPREGSRGAGAPVPALPAVAPGGSLCLLAQLPQVRALLRLPWRWKRIIPHH